MYTNATPNSRPGAVTLRIYALVNALLLVGVCGFLWVLASRANNHGIPPSTSLGFRSQATLASLQGWYVAQRVGFHFAALAASGITVAAFGLAVVVYVRRASPAWILLIPALAGLGIGVSMLLAGQRADKAAVTVENPKAEQSMTGECSSVCRSQRVQVRYRVAGRQRLQGEDTWHLTVWKHW